MTRELLDAITRAVESEKDTLEPKLRDKLQKQLKIIDFLMNLENFLKNK